VQKGHGGGEKVGKYKVKAGKVDVQLEEDLTENLRGLKVGLSDGHARRTALIPLLFETQPEGNLFRDRFLSLQQRALIEPRIPQLSVFRHSRLRTF
jgi:nucleolar protein 53